MAKLTAWLVTLIGVLWLIYMITPLEESSPTSGWMGWVIALSFLIIGIGKLVRNYKRKPKK